MESTKSIRVDSVLPEISNNLDAIISTHLESHHSSNMDAFDFAANRIRIVNMQRKIVKLRANNIQKLHQKNKEKLSKERGSRHFLLLKYRRGGITTWEQMLSYRAMITNSNTHCVTLADTGENTLLIFKMVKLMARLDPKAPPDLDDMTRRLLVPSINSTFYIGTAGSKAFGRGVPDLFRVHGSEVSRWPGKYDEIEDLVAGLSESARYGEVVLETTAAGTRGWFYETYAEAMRGGNAWIPLFYPWFIEPENILPCTVQDVEEITDTLTDDESELIESYDLSWEQIKWRRNKKFQRKKLFQQEYPESWEKAFVSHGFLYFDFDLDVISAKCKEPIKESGSLTVWENPQDKCKYCVGVDTSEGGENSDYCVAAVLNKTTSEQVAVLRGKWRDSIFAKKIVELCKSYNDAVCAIELNNTGHSVMNTIINVLRYKNLYYHKQEIKRDKYGQNVQDKVPGWRTDGKTRPVLLSNLAEAIEEGYIRVNDRVLLSEMRVFVDTGGKYEADRGQHDDSIMAWGITWQARLQREKSFIY